jgi:phage tail-like protein
MASATVGTRDLFIGLKFWVEIDGVASAYFTECSGLNVETEVQEYAEGGVNDYTIKLPGRTKFSNVTLKRGWVETDELWKWYLKVIEGQFETRSVSIVMYENRGISQAPEKSRWSLDQAFPVKWQGPTFAATSNTFVVETLELAHRGFRRQS